MERKKQYKQWLIPVITTLIVSSTVTPTFADEGIFVNIDGKPIFFDVQPTVIEGRTMVPLREIFESLGAKLVWEQATSTVKATKGSTSISLPVGSHEAVVNHRTLHLDVPATIIEGRTMVPARFVAESLGCSVEWDGNTSTVNIYRDSSVNHTPDPKTEPSVSNGSSSTGDPAALESIEQLKQAMEYYPEQGDTYAFNIAAQYYEVGHYDEGTKYIFIAVDAKKQKRESLYSTFSSAAQMLFNHGQVERANQLLDDAIAMDSENTLPYQMMKK
ncbi:hypothetical protein H1S01_07390 [Heliobacterium chlorum]|uniref:Copper amine oxidase-like N-terminal domain-containing protein n=1 Tax=Heliobacterium chlorum TaxID=2698 RepID=A0ABR7T0L1_HELCL|nr:stalk domain-containing protein [Heliobacterium chlorum]MBC9784333.1 hypothetical protein [Heliobacterium chlorum]